LCHSFIYKPFISIFLLLKVTKKSAQTKILQSLIEKIWFNSPISVSLRHKKTEQMVKMLLLGLALLLITVLLLGVRVFFVKDGKFPNMHIGGNKAMQEKGISCAKSQDRAQFAQGESPVEKALRQ
jgi:hypothetical protein